MFFYNRCGTRNYLVVEIAYVLGGVDKEDQALTTVTEINLETDVVSEGQSMGTPRCSFAVATSPDEIFVCGGRNKEFALTSCERLRPAERCERARADSRQ